MTTTGPGLVRDAVPDDAVRCAEIYAPYVRDTAISFETEPPTAADMARRIADAQRDHAWLVLEDGGEVTGYAYGGPLFWPAALRWAATVSGFFGGAPPRYGGGGGPCKAAVSPLPPPG